MPQVCLPAGCIDAIRVAVIDDCTDEAAPGLTNGYVFNCFRSLELTTNVEDGEETILRNDCGKKCFQSRSCDELTNVGISFELLNPDYELTSLLTGQSLIFDGIENIGWFHTEGRSCAPWLSVELFEQVPDEVCAPAHKYRRIVIPKVRFRPVPSNTREGQLRIIGIEGVSAAASIAAWGDGPFDDSPFDFSGLDPNIQTHIMEFFDSSITETLEGTCGFIPVSPNLLFTAQWTGQDELTVEAPTGSTAFCDADEIVIELESGPITLTLPDPCVTIVDCDTAVITCWDTINPDNETIISVGARQNGESLGSFDTDTDGDGNYAMIPVSTGFWEELFPDIGTSDGHILMGANPGPGCYYLSMWYNCDTDKLAVAFNRKDLYGTPGTVARTEVETTDGVTADVPLVDEWKTPGSVWTYGSGFTIENASSYGLDWTHIRAYDENDDLICEWRDPIFTWHGGPWLLDPERCVGGDLLPPVVDSVVVIP